MSGFQISEANSRQAFETAARFLAQNGMNIQNANPTQSFLRTEIAITSTTQSYTVPILVNDLGNSTTMYPADKRLNLQDIFVPIQVGVFVGVAASSTASVTELLTYPNLTQFSTAGAAAATMNLYAGNMSVINNNVQVLPAWDLWRHYKVPMVQQTANADYTASGISYKDAIDGSVDGFYPIAPSFLYTGTAKYQIQLNLTTAISTVQSNSRIVVLHRGILCQNVTKIV